MRSKKDKSITDDKDFDSYVAVDAVWKLCELFSRAEAMTEYCTFEEREGAIWESLVGIRLEIVKQIFRICEEFFRNEQQDKKEK